MSEQRIQSPDNYGPVIKVMTLFLGSTSLLCVAVRYLSKFGLSRKFGLDDAAVLVSLLFSIGFTAAIYIQSSNGLGSPENRLTELQLEVYQKTSYASGFLYIATLLFSKASIIILLHLLPPVSLHRHLTVGLGVLTVLWAITGFLGNAFQCQLPDAWRTIEGACFNQTSFWTYMAVLNIVTEIGILVLPALLLRKSRMKMGLKVKVFGVFSGRILVIAAIITWLVYHYQRANSQDHTISSWKAAVCTQFVQALSIITACIPYLKTTFSSLQSDLLRLDDERRREYRTVQSSESRKGPVHGSLWKKAFADRKIPDMIMKSFSLDSWKSRSQHQDEGTHQEADNPENIARPVRTETNSERHSIYEDAPQIQRDAAETL